MAHSVGQAVDQAALIARQLTLGRWRAAEDQIYPLVSVDPEAYIRAVRAIAELTEVLRAEHSTAEELFALDVDGFLIAHANDLPALLDAGFPPATLAHAALAQVVALLPAKD